MTRRSLVAAAVVLLALAGRGGAAEPKLTVKVEDTPPPKELSEPVRALLDTRAISVSDGGKLLCTVWPRKALDSSKATAEQVQAGLVYTNIDETTLLGAVR